MEFVLPQQPLQLADILAGDPCLPRGYAQRLADIRIPDGFLTGFIDLIAMHNGAFWVIDWKTNRLVNYRCFNHSYRNGSSSLLSSGCYV